MICIKVSGIIAEYNPFHNGHKYLIDKAKEGGATHVVAVMSGNYVQRGEPAIFEKSLRAKAAIESGCDLVVELPVVYAVSGAQKFAQAGVSVLEGLGLVDELVFGSESNNINVIKKAIELLKSDEVQNLILKELECGITYAKARERALAGFDKECAKLITEPNDILALEYISAIDRINGRMKPVAVKRCGPGHDEAYAVDGIASASRIRELIMSESEWKEYVGEEIYPIYNEAVLSNRICDYDKFKLIAMYKMKTMTAERIANCADISEGLENRMFQSAMKETSYDQLTESIKTKRYTMARIKRIILNAVLDIPKELSGKSVPYIHVLAMNDKGRELLKTAKKTSMIPVVTKPSDLKKLNEDANLLFKTELRSDEIYEIITNC